MRWGFQDLALRCVYNTQSPRHTCSLERICYPVWVGMRNARYNGVPLAAIPCLSRALLPLFYPLYCRESVAIRQRIRIICVCQIKNQSTNLVNGGRNAIKFRIRSIYFGYPYPQFAYITGVFCTLLFHPLSVLPEADWFFELRWKAQLAVESYSWLCLFLAVQR